jgi:hypothetical protein
LPTEDLKSWTPASKEQPKVIIQSGNFKSIKDLMNYLKLNIPTLYTFYHYAGIWAASAGVYPIIFKNTLWLLEEAKCPVDIAKELYDTKCVPRLVEVGYPNDKLYKPFEHAINYYLGKEG